MSSSEQYPATGGRAETDVQPIRFQRGQLILAPFKGRHVLWSVTRVKPNGKAHLLAEFEQYHCEITTTVAVLPDDWRVVSQFEAVRALLPEEHEG